MLLEGKNAIVTGGSQGIGTAASLELAKEGANVCLTYRRHENEARAVADQIEKMGRKAICVACDIAVFAEAEAAVKAAVDAFGRIDILVNNAGMNWDGVCWKMSEEQWDRVIAVNLKGYFNFTRQVAPLLKEQKYGKIINVTSINGMRGKFGQTNYSASKAGIIGYTKAVAKELGAFGVNVNAVAPGLIETAMLKNSEARDKIIDLAMGEMALKRIGQPEDLASVIAFLASDKARHITGDVIKVDGGQYI
ncbi:SDR family NAD(P)-dependent oxidoreductase [Desulfosarcina sp.]|uniref:SDR family NAD(P)-dependent oxidoreductase n=1 Tax=Desulfosarcina sp. TaxID=2027861 RepID=UPI0029B37878|nr:SDR family NAD(P)-dependent oxidoreductase [Desulfosarcina sp.]MDX2453893.1 SDR family NAD(P)-dependent oxidoreductase [Desulfosarcina sp.]MDX2491594.1 SDR family NAD(P)-dependent oxidoreductase [Desulfosarcina sp.]